MKGKVLEGKAVITIQQTHNIEYINKNNLTITFASAEYGGAYIN